MKLLILFLILFSNYALSFAPEFFNDLAIEEEKRSVNVIPYLQLKQGDTVADLGAGGGYFSIKMAKVVGEKGMVYAVDIDTESTEYIKNYAKENGLNNVKVILATPHNSKLPQNSLDLIFIRNTYHHFENRVTYFQKLAKTLKPGGRIAIIDYLPEKNNYSWHSTEVSIMIKEMKQAGFIVQKQFFILKRQSFLIFEQAEF